MQKNLNLTPLSTHCVIGDTSPLENELLDYIEESSAISEFVIKQQTPDNTLNTQIPTTPLTPLADKRKLRHKYNCQSFTESLYRWNGYLKKKFEESEKILKHD